MMFSVSACDVRQLPSPSNSDHNKTVNTSKKKKHQRLTEEDGDVQENTVLARAKRGRKKKSISEDGWDNSFIALVTASNLKADTLYLPQDCTSSNGLQKKYCKIVLTDGRSSSWELDLRFNKSSDSFYITRGWRHFCDENGKKAGSLFTFELMKNGGTPLLSFSPSKSTTLSYETSQDQDKFVTLKLTYDSLKNSRLYLPSEIMIKNGLDESRLVTLLGKDGTRTLANLIRETTGKNLGRLRLGKGWRKFAVANNLKVDEHFTLECIWENETPILKLSDTKSKRGIRQGRRKISKAIEKVSVSTESKDGKEHEKGKNIEEPITNRNRLVILPLVPQEVKACMLLLPSQFLKANGIDKPGKIVLLGRNEFESWCGYLLSGDGNVAVGCGWRNFCEANGVKIGESFSLEFMHKDDTTSVLKFCPNSRE